MFCSATAPSELRSGRIEDGRSWIADAQFDALSPWALQGAWAPLPLLCPKFGRDAHAPFLSRFPISPLRFLYNPDSLFCAALDEYGIGLKISNSRALLEAWDQTIHDQPATEKLPKITEAKRATPETPLPKQFLHLVSCLLPS
jgi:hypothetical protein